MPEMQAMKSSFDMFCEQAETFIHRMAPMRPMWTNDPEADFIANDAYQHEIDELTKIGECCMCGINIHGEGCGYEADDAYYFGGDYVCDDCLRAYCKEHYGIG